MTTHPTPTTTSQFLRTHALKIAVALVALAVLLTLAATLTALSASTASGLFVGAIFGGSAAVVAGQRKNTKARASRRQSDEIALDGLEPLRPERPS